jgi:NAD(P)-dependent dehydrogenase (short-subunit alcohol dehydrogenase family)
VSTAYSNSEWSASVLVGQADRMQTLKDRVAVVTGAASGIGLGITEAFVAQGMKVMLCDVDEPRLAGQEHRLAALGATVASMVVNVGEAAQVDELAAGVLARFGDVSVICNNAGIIRPGRTWELPVSDWEAVLRVNLLGVVHGVRTFVPLLLASGHEGHIVNVASMAAVVPVVGIGPYNVSKHGVLALSEVLHSELAAAGAPIGVTVVMPGRVRTHLGRPPGTPDPEPSQVEPLQPGELDPAEVGAQVVDAILGNQLHLFTHPDRIGEVVARFARITGSVSGGRGERAAD